MTTTLIRNADVYAPEPLGRRDLLLSIEERAIRGAGDLFAGLPRTSIGAVQKLRLPSIICWIS